MRPFFLLFLYFDLKQSFARLEILCLFIPSSAFFRMYPHGCFPPLQCACKITSLRKHSWTDPKAFSKFDNQGTFWSSLGTKKRICTQSRPECNTVALQLRKAYESLIIYERKCLIRSGKLWYSLQISGICYSNVIRSVFVFIFR